MGRLVIESVRIIEDHLNLQNQIQAINAFDATISYPLSEVSSDRGYWTIISELILVTTGRKTKKMFNPYIYKAWETFVANKKSITIRYNTRYFGQLEQLLFHPFK